MDAKEIRAMYRSMCLQTITVRRRIGDSPNDYVVKGNARVYSGKELAGTIVQGDQQIILVAADLVAAGLSLPLLASDRVRPGDRFLAIIGAPGERKALDGTVIAYDLQARG